MRVIASTVLVAFALACGGGADLAAPQTDGGVSAKSCAVDPTAVGALVDPCATALYSVAPDGGAALIDHQPETSSPFRADLFLASGGRTTQIGPAEPVVTGTFSPDGRSILLRASASSNTGDLRVARADGSEARVLTDKSMGAAFAGRWLYYGALTDTEVVVSRLQPPDGAAETIGRLPRADTTSLWLLPSPDGESIAWCAYAASSPARCFLHRADGSTAQIATGTLAWSPDGSRILTGDCTILDMAGRVQSAGGCATSAWSPDGSIFGSLDATPIFYATAGVRLLFVGTGDTVQLPPPAPVDWSVFRSRKEIGFTPDGSRVVVVEGHASFSAPVRGGAWTLISADHGARSPSESDFPSMSPDGRIVADTTSGDLVESIDGAAPRVVRAPDGTAMVEVGFEPLGGLNRAIFIGNGPTAWLASADASAGWMKLPGGADSFRWIGRTALFHAGDRIMAVTDDGKQLATLATGVKRWVFAGGKLFYFASGGGLFAVDGLPQPSL